MTKKIKTIFLLSLLINSGQILCFGFKDIVYGLGLIFAIKTYSLIGSGGNQSHLSNCQYGIVEDPVLTGLYVKDSDRIYRCKTAQELIREKLNSCAFLDISCLTELAKEQCAHGDRICINDQLKKLHAIKEEEYSRI